MGPDDPNDGWDDAAADDQGNNGSDSDDHSNDNTGVTTDD